MKDLDTFIEELLEEYPEVKIAMAKLQEKEDRKNNKKLKRENTKIKFLSCYHIIMDSILQSFKRFFNIK